MKRRPPPAPEPIDRIPFAAPAVKNGNGGRYEEFIDAVRDEHKSNGKGNGQFHPPSGNRHAAPQRSAVVGYNDVHPSLKSGFEVGESTWLEQAAELRRGPKKHGYPQKYRAWFPQIVFEMRLLGASYRAIARACDVSELTIRAWAGESAQRPQEVIPEFREAMLQGSEMADARVAKSMYHRAVGYTHPDEKIFYAKDVGVVRVDTLKHYPPDPSAGTFWLTNRRRDKWRNRMTQEMVDDDGNTLVPPQLVVMPVQSTDGKKTKGAPDENSDQ